MLILKIKDYLQKSTRVGIIDLAKHFNIDIDHTRHLLAKWVKKGVLTKELDTADCSSKACGCKSCALVFFEFYTWNK